LPHDLDKMVRQQSLFGDASGFVPARRQLLTMRLTCYSYSDWLIRQIPSGLPSAALFSQAAAESGRRATVAEVLPIAGARPPVFVTDYFFTFDHAPMKPEAPVFQSTTTLVDTAGWTEMVIQERTGVLFYVITGQRAEVNASVNHVMEAALPVDLMLSETGGGWFDPCTCGCPGWSDVNDNKLSCQML